MTMYKNFTIDFPQRLGELDLKFRPIVDTADLGVSYVLIKLSSAFLLPYERIEGTSGARHSDIKKPQSIRKNLELDKRFREAKYCLDIHQWALSDVDNFQCGPDVSIGIEN